MAWMSVKNLVCNKLARQNIFCFINSISILVILIYCYHYSHSSSFYCSCSSSYYYHYHFYYYYHYYYYFIVIILVLSMLFILFHFLLFRLLWFLSVILYEECVSPRFFSFSFFVNDLQYILTLLIYFKHVIHVIITINFFFFSTLLVIGGEFSKSIRAAWSTPTHWLLWVSRRLSITIIIFCLFCKLFFGDHRWGVDALFQIYHMTSFNHDA